jgi:hypothetical protein
MAIEYKGEKQIWERDGVAVSTARVVASGRDFGKRYLVTQGEWMIPCATLERAEEIADEVLTGARKLGEEAPEEA